MKLEQLPLLEPKQVVEVEGAPSGWRMLVQGVSPGRVRVKAVKRPPEKK